MVDHSPVRLGPGMVCFVDHNVVKRVRRDQAERLPLREGLHCGEDVAAVEVLRCSSEQAVVGIRSTQNLLELPDGPQQDLLAMNDEEHSRWVHGPHVKSREHRLASASRGDDDRSTLSLCAYEVECQQSVLLHWVGLDLHGVRAGRQLRSRGVMLRRCDESLCVLVDPVLCKRSGI